MYFCGPRDILWSLGNLDNKQFAGLVQPHPAACAWTNSWGLQSPKTLLPPIPGGCSFWPWQVLKGSWTWTLRSRFFERGKLHLPSSIKVNRAPIHSSRAELSQLPKSVPETTCSLIFSIDEWTGTARYGVLIADGISIRGKLDAKRSWETRKTCVESLYENLNQLDSINSII